MKEVNNDRSRLGRDENKRHILQRTIPQSGRPQRKEAGFDSSWTFDPDVSVARASIAELSHRTCTPTSAFFQFVTSFEIDVKRLETGIL